MIDLHTHTNKSDGSLSPLELIRLACATGLEALAITDHDTFAGFDEAYPIAGELGLELLCGIELSTTYENRSVHLLGYFLNDEPHEDFRQWILSLQNARCARNEKLVHKLQTMGFEINIEEVQERGSNLPGRPHFAALMVEKGYVASVQQAFDEYLGETGACFVRGSEPSFADTVARIHAAGGISSLAHPTRLSRDPATIESYVRDMRELGLYAIEAYHSDYSPSQISLYAALAEEFSLAITGGSDFHGATKPGVSLGTGRNANLRIPISVLRELRELLLSRSPRSCPGLIV